MSERRLVVKGLSTGIPPTDNQHVDRVLQLLQVGNQVVNTTAESIVAVERWFSVFADSSTVRV